MAIRQPLRTMLPEFVPDKFNNGEQTMKLHNKLCSPLLIAGISVFLISTQSIAHESRIITNADGAQLRMTVGNQPEPVFAGQLSRTDLILNMLDGNGDPNIPVDTSTGASIADLSAYIMFLKEDAPVESLDDPLVKKSMELHDIALARGENNRYQTPIIYSRPGAYGVWYVGSIVANDGTVFEIDEFFVCGGGSLADPREDGSVPAFGCVEAPVSFPDEFHFAKGDDDHGKKEHGNKKSKSRHDR